MDELIMIGIVIVVITVLVALAWVVYASVAGWFGLEAIPRTKRGFDNLRATITIAGSAGMICIIVGALFNTLI